MDFIHYQPSADNYISEDRNDNTGGRVETILDFDGTKLNQEVQMEESAEDLTEEEMERVSVKKSQKYKKYGQDQIERFIRIKQEQGLSVPKAAALCGIPRSTAYELLNEFNSSDGTVLPRNKKPKKTSNKPKKLFPEHSAFLIDLFEKNPSIVLGEAKAKLCEAFPGLEISISGLYRHIREKCALSLKQATKYTTEKDATRTL
jgi:transposase